MIFLTIRREHVIASPVVKQKEEYLYVVLVSVCLLLQIGLSEFGQLWFIAPKLQKSVVATIMQMLPVSERVQ